MGVHLYVNRPKQAPQLSEMKALLTGKTSRLAYRWLRSGEMSVSTSLFFFGFGRVTYGDLFSTAEPCFPSIHSFGRWCFGNGIGFVYVVCAHV